MRALARLGDGSDHGGTIVSASSSVTADGKGVAREGDSHSCPITGHGTTALSHGTPPTTITVDGRKAIYVGDTAGCGAAITSGSPTVFAGP
jgi:uncharacterized Zn-binding protein involved in type VI secretion